MKKIIKLVLVLLWMGLIFMFSNQNADDSSQVSDGLIVKTASIFVDKNLSNDKKEELIEKYSHIVRKTAHFTIYLVLGVLVLNFILELDLKHIIMVSLCICILYSMSDEFHQMFIDGRSGELLDVLIDSIGSYVGIVLFYNIRKKFLIFFNKKSLT